MTPAQRDRNLACPPRRTAMISARIATAISCGVVPPNSSPIGAYTRSSSFRHDAVGAQVIEDRLALGAAADHTDVAHGRSDHVAQAASSDT